MAFLKFNKAELVNLSYSLKREIICANKTGAYCNTTIVACNTRRYHGLLSVPVDNFGGGKYMLLSSVDESLEVNGKVFNLGIHRYGDIYEPRGHKYIVDFAADPVPVITYRVGQIEFTKSILLVPDKDQVMLRYEVTKSPAKLRLSLKPFLAFRSVHSLTSQNSSARTDFRQVRNGVSFNMYEGFPDLNLQLSTASFKYKSAPCWYNAITYSDEARRGFACKEDLFVPGSFELSMGEGDSIVLSASVSEEVPSTMKRRYASALKSMPGIVSLHDQLIHCADVLIRDRNGRKTVTAGFSWLYTGLLRETLEALPGLTLYANGDKAEFEEILDNLIADNQERLFHRTTQVEAPLRLADTLGRYIGFGADPKAVWKKYGPTVKGIVESYLPGRRVEVAMQPNGLLWAQLDHWALSWMNTYVDGNPVTERAGYQVETNAMWFQSVLFAVTMERKYSPSDSAFLKEWSHILDLIRENFQNTFWNARAGYLADYVDNAGQHLEVRPNMLYALVGEDIPVEPEIARRVLQVIDNELVTRRGIRTLSPRHSEYKGVYEGSQTDRDLAYYNGCCLTSLLGPYCEVCFKMKGAAFLNKAQWLVNGFYEDLNKHGVGAFSELYDGDPPHEPHGAISSALSTAALLEVEYLKNKYKEE